MKKSCNYLELPKTVTAANKVKSTDNYSSGKLSSYRKDSSEGYVSDCSTQADLTDHYYYDQQNNNNANSSNTSSISNINYGAADYDG